MCVCACVCVCACGCGCVCVCVVLGCMQRTQHSGSTPRYTTPLLAAVCSPYPVPKTHAKTNQDKRTTTTMRERLHMHTRRQRRRHTRVAPAPEPCRPGPGSQQSKEQTICREQRSKSFQIPTERWSRTQKEGSWAHSLTVKLEQCVSGWMDRKAAGMSPFVCDQHC